MGLTAVRWREYEKLQAFAKLLRDFIEMEEACGLVERTKAVWLSMPGHEGSS